MPPLTKSMIENSCWQLRSFTLSDPRFISHHFLTCSRLVFRRACLTLQKLDGRLYSLGSLNIVCLMSWTSDERKFFLWSELYKFTVWTAGIRIGFFVSAIHSLQKFSMFPVFAFSHFYGIDDWLKRNFVVTSVPHKLLYDFFGGLFLGQDLDHSVFEILFFFLHLKCDLEAMDFCLWGNCLAKFFVSTANPNEQKIIFFLNLVNFCTNHVLARF